MHGLTHLFVNRGGNGCLAGILKFVLNVANGKSAAIHQKECGYEYNKFPNCH